MATWKDLKDLEEKYNFFDKMFGFRHVPIKVRPPKGAIGEYHPTVEGVWGTFMIQISFQTCIKMQIDGRNGRGMSIKDQIEPEGSRAFEVLKDWLRAEGMTWVDD